MKKKNEILTNRAGIEKANFNWPGFYYAKTLEATAVKIACTKNKRFFYLASKPTKHKQTNNRPKFFEPEILPFKKIGPCQIRT